MKTHPIGSLRLNLGDSKSNRRGRLSDTDSSIGCAARPVRFVLLAGFLLLTASAGRVLGQPTIINQPRTQAVPPGANVTFTVEASGTGPLVYQWQRNPGTGFSDLADCTNAVLELTNAQPWDALDYRVVVTDLTGAQTSAAAHLYVMSPGLLTGREVVDDFDDNKLTRWKLLSGGQLTETNQRLTVSGYWPGVISYDPPETVAAALLQRNWSIADGTTVEWRTDLVGMSEHATAALLEVVHAGADGLYVIFKGRDFIKVNKYFVDRGPAHFLHENVSIRNTNVVLALALTRVSPDLILTARVLDKANPGVRVPARTSGSWT